MISNFCASAGLTSASMYSIVICFERYSYDSEAIAIAARAVLRRVEHADLQSALRLARMLRVCSDSENCLVSVRSQRLFWRCAIQLMADQNRDEHEHAAERDRAVLRAAALERASRCRATGLQRVDQRDGQAGDGQPLVERPASRVW